MQIRSFSEMAQVGDDNDGSSEDWSEIKRGLGAVAKTVKNHMYTAIAASAITAVLLSRFFSF